ncbi:MAG: hypothetical protein WCV86_00330 [Patescibacteria group bacterium]|jgi:hypothetical protein
MATSVTKRAIIFLLTTLLFDVLRFPVWWYTTGTWRALQFFGQEALQGIRNLSIVVLFKNLLKPMYGDYTKSGRAISLVLRLILFGVRIVMYVLWLLILVLFVLLWLALPIGTAYLFIRSVFHVG